MENGRQEQEGRFWTKGMIGLVLVAVSISVLGVVVIINSRSDSAPSSTALTPPPLTTLPHAAGMTMPTVADDSSTPSIETVVDVNMTEFSYTMVPAVVPPGRVTFVITNSGAVPHDFVIPDLGIHSPHLDIGDTETLVVDIPKEGTFKVVCLVAGHEAAGMVSSLKVN